jgi:hypothetical protein
MVVMFVLGAPLQNNNYLLFAHSIFVPFMVAHWIMNDNTCVLSVVEIAMRKKLAKQKGTVEIDRNDCYMCRLIDPIYEFKKNNSSYGTLIYSTTFIMWIISTARLYDRINSGKIKQVDDLFNNIF